MSIDEIIEAKLYRLDELKKYQSYYGPNTPYPVIVEINDLEAELQQLLQSRQAAPVKKKKKKKRSAPSLWRISQPTFDAIATIVFIGLIFLFGSIIWAAYSQSHRRAEAIVAENPDGGGPPPLATLRPTFTPTADPSQPVDPAQPADPAAQPAAMTVIENPNLPDPVRQPTQLPTLVPTLTPSSTPEPTLAPTPTETPVPLPTQPPPAPAPAAKPAAAAVPAQPTAPPAPAFPFAVAEQGNRTFQPTHNGFITIYVAAVSEGNIPIGDLKVIGDHVPTGQHVESTASDWFWSATNCLDCGYVKKGNVKLEPGPFSDGVWNIYLADLNGTPLSPVVPLSYSADPGTWVWDFIIFRRING